MLFVSASSFTHYMSSGTDSVYGGYTYDVSVYPRYEKDTDRVLPLLAGLPDVEEYAVLRSATGTVRVPREALSPVCCKTASYRRTATGTIHWRSPSRLLGNPPSARI